MSFLSIFFKPKKEVQEMNNEPQNIKPEIQQEDFIDNSEPDKDNIVAIQYGTHMPIDAIYAFIARDYEDVGYEDAMCNMDPSYKESKILLIRNELKRLFEQVNLRYKKDLRELEVQINLVAQQGLMNTSAELNARKQTYLEHMDKTREMELALERNEQHMLGMINSYERGFLKGLAAKSETLLRNGNN